MIRPSPSRSMYSMYKLSKKFNVFKHKALKKNFNFELGLLINFLMPSKDATKSRGYEHYVICFTRNLDFFFFFFFLLKSIPTIITQKAA